MRENNTYYSLSEYHKLNKHARKESTEPAVKAILITSFALVFQSSGPDSRGKLN